MTHYDNKDEYNLNDVLFDCKGKVICWKCKAIILINKTWENVICAICSNLNIIPSYTELKRNTFLDSKYLSQFLIVQCHFCQHQMKTKRESNYIMCVKCKNIVIIIKEDMKIPNNTNPFQYLKFKIDKFNK